MKKILRSISPARLTTTVFFVVHFFYFLIFNRYHLYYQEQIQLFRFDWNYFVEYLSRPGGIAEYIGTFFTQFFIIPGAGPFLVTLAAFAAFLLTRLILRKTGTSGILFAMVPVFVLAALQSDQIYYVGHSVGYLLSIALVALYISAGNDKVRYIMGIFGIMILYPVAGVFALMASVGIILYEALFKTGRPRWFAIAVILMISALFPYLMWTRVYNLILGSAWLTPLFFIGNDYTRHWLTALFVYIPLLMIFTGLWRVLPGRKMILFRWELRTILPGLIVVFLLLFLTGRYAFDKRTEQLLGMDYHIQKGNYTEALKISSGLKGSNRIAVYLTNLALAKSGELGESLFNYHQTGSGGLKLAWGDDASVFFGSDLFYHIAYINEAYHWAFESMVSKGQSPRVMIQLAKTSVINGDYEAAGKFLNILHQTIFYRKFARRYNEYLIDRELMKQDPEINEKRKFMLHNDFFSDVNDFELVLSKLLENHPDNRYALEYLMASFLLDKKIERFAGYCSRIKDFYPDGIPVHYEEALLVYVAEAGAEQLPDGCVVSDKTRDRFNDYLRTYASFTGNPDRLAQFMGTRFGNTYWYYLHFK